MVNRIVGLASGMDIDSIVSKLMQAERMPLDKLTQKKQTLEWQRDDYRTMNSLFLDFKNNLTNLKLTQQYRVRSVSTTNDSLVSASASSGASMSSYSISDVKQLATAANKVNTGAISGSTKVDLTKSIISQQSNFATPSFTWDEGAVESASITTTGSNSVQMNLNGETLKTDATSGQVDANLINVKVNGTSYKVITDPAATVGSNEVYISTSGQLTFNSSDSNITSTGNSIKVDYVTTNKIETATIKSGSTDWQLSQTNLKSISVHNSSNNLDYTLNGNQLVNGSDVLGTIDMVTGKLTFTTGKISADTSLSATYIEQYNKFSLQTYTSTGQKSQNFFVKAGDTLNSVINQVNNSNVGISMFYDSSTDKMTMTRSETGNFNGEPGHIIDSNGNSIVNPNYSPTITDPITGQSIPNPNYEIVTSGTFIDNVLKFSGATETGGDDALFNINGLQTTRKSNSFQMNGVSFTLKQTFTNPVSVTVTNDTDKIYDNIKAFVDQYNTLIDTVNNKVTEERYRDYTPLSDDQRQQMSDTQQQQWDAKAKSGLLKGDSILTSSLSEMRTLIYQPVSNGNVVAAYNQLASIGITTSPDYTQGGKLEIDETKLKQAIQDDPDSVENLFRGTGDTTSSKGVVQRLYDSVSGTINQLNDRAGKSYSTNQSFTIGRNLDDLNVQISAFNDKLTQIENRYYTQFNAMDQAMQNANSQASYLAQYFK